MTNRWLHLALLLLVLGAATAGLIYLVWRSAERYLEVAGAEKAPPDQGQEEAPSLDDDSAPAAAGSMEAETAIRGVQVARKFRPPPDRVELFKALESSLQSGDPSLVIDLEDAEEELLFENWSRAARGKGELCRLSLRFLKRDPDGLEHYELRIEEPPVIGVVRASVEDGSWHLKGVGAAPREPAGAPAQEDALKALQGKSQPGESDQDLEAPAPEGSSRS